MRRGSIARDECHKYCECRQCYERSHNVRITVIRGGAYAHKVYRVEHARLGVEYVAKKASNLNTNDNHGFMGQTLYRGSSKAKALAAVRRP